MQTALLPTARWSLPKRIGMLFVTVYLFFLVADFTSDDEIFPAFFYKLMKPWIGFWNRLVPWTGTHILRLSQPITVTPNGSGDTTYNYVMQLLWVVLALLIAVVWALADRRRPGYDRLYYWVRVVMRYYFAYVLFVYGFVKIIKLQFPFPSLARLTETYGDSSPMGLAWTFIGYSKGYNMFTGGAEVLAGTLLFFKRTTLLGSLMAMTIMTNVVAMNMAYDIPVKIFSLNLVFLSAFLAGHDFKRIKNVFFLNSAAPPPYPDRRPATRRNFIIQRSLKALFILLALYFTFWSALLSSGKYGDAAPKPPLYGIYNVDSFVQKGVALPPLTTDSARWKQLIIQGGYGRITTMTGNATWMELKVDTIKKHIMFSSGGETADSALLQYSEPDKEHLLLSGLIYDDSVRILLKRFDLRKFTLVNRGFHWVNEYPYNR